MHVAPISYIDSILGQLILRPGINFWYEVFNYSDSNKCSLIKVSKIILAITWC